MLEVDDEVVEVGVVEVGVEHLPAPLGPPLVGVADVAHGLLVGEPQAGDGGVDPEVERRHQPHLEHAAETVEDELTDQPAVDAVAVGEEPAERRLHGEDVAFLALGEALEEVRRHVEAAVHLLLGDAVALGCGDRVLEPDDLEAEPLVEGLRELLRAAVAALGNRDDWHGASCSSAGAGTRRERRRGPTLAR